LTDLLLEAENDKHYYQSLKRACRKLKPLTAPRREQANWRNLLAELQT